MGRLFGTDGARGIANKELTIELAMKIGKAAAEVLAVESKRPKILIAKDTRISCDMLESALSAGLCSVGADVVSVGVVPTPCAAYLIGELGCSAGIMISASHNPFEYNGIKLFDKNGFKLPDALEEEIEAIVLDDKGKHEKATDENIGRVYYRDDAIDIYVEHLISTVDVDFSGLKIAFDCANGASYQTAQKVFKKLGAECSFLSTEPTGVNINLNCGSTHLENLQSYVVENKCDCGIAFDGDADRCLAVDSEGNVVDGDMIIAISANDLKQRNELDKNTVVMTVMSNIGFFKFAEREGIDVKTTKVGDRYVLEEMRANGYIIGGEQSGHIIYLKHASTGDGQLSAIQLIATMKRTGKSLKELASIMEQFPQVLVNVTVTKEIKEFYAESKVVRDAIVKAEQQLGDDGRVLVRASGTEPLVRVMIEGKNIDEITAMAEEIADKIKNLKI
ncbi:MAG: phosphoglucosamine mutase [Clostridia bacterium]|nr:phosphoglucosamine mutase [Clostridia bacterium]